MLDKLASATQDILQDLGKINKSGASKSDAISDAASNAMSKISDDGGIAMQGLETAASAVPGGAQVMGAVKIADGLAQGDVTKVIDGATDFVPGVKQVKDVVKKAGIMKMS